MRFRTALLLLALAASQAVAQTPVANPKKFEVASIKINRDSNEPVMLDLRPGPRFVATNIPFRLLLRLAFRPLQDSLILGGPAWMNDEKVDVEARAEEPLSSDDLGPALLSLLEERCGLRSHRETRDLPVYILAIAKGGPKIKQVDPPVTYGGNTFGSVGYLPPYARPISQLVTFLSPQLDRPIIDRTELNGYYQLELRFTPPYVDRAAASPAADSTTTIFTALPEQLGLRLEPGRAPVEVLVVDSLNKPTENWRHSADGARLKYADDSADTGDMDISAIALGGLHRAEVKLENAATGIASFRADSSGGGNADTVNLSAGMVATMSAQTEFAANLKTVETAGEEQKSLIHLVA